MSQSCGPDLSLPAHIFKQYDIRAVVPEDLHRESAILIGRAFGHECLERSIDEVLIACDARLSSPELKSGLIEGLLSTGCDVIDIGTVPTPILYFAVHHSVSGTGLMVTASHNPPEYNGVKMVLAHHALFGDAIQKLYSRINKDLGECGPRGQSKTKSVVESYFSKICYDIHVARPLRVVLDCANGIAGDFAPEVLRAIGCEVIELYCDVDGRFPNHPGDPTRPENLQDLIHAVTESGADLGLSLDGDGDRVVAIAPQGEIIWPDRLMILFAEDILVNNPGRKVVFDVKCMRALCDTIRRTGGEPVMWKTGHSLIRSKLFECDGIFGGEMSGHLYFQDRWPGFDDGIYASARLCELISKSPSSPAELFQALPTSVCTPEIRIPCDAPHEIVEQFSQKVRFESVEVIKIDGLRVEFSDGFGLIRASNTAPEIVLRFDADSKSALDRIQGLFEDPLSEVLNRKFAFDD